MGWGEGEGEIPVTGLPVALASRSNAPIHALLPQSVVGGLQRHIHSILPTPAPLTHRFTGGERFQRQGLEPLKGASPSPSLDFALAQASRAHIV